MINLLPDSDSIRHGTIVLKSTIHWDHTWQRHQQIATRFAQRGYQVYFVSPLPGRWSPGASRLKQKIRDRFRLPTSTPGGSMHHPMIDGIEIINIPGVPDKHWPARQFNQRIAVQRMIRLLKSSTDFCHTKI